MEALVSSLCMALAVLAAVGARAVEAPAPATVEAAYPGLASGVLASATLADLPDGVLARLGKADVPAKEVDDILAKAPEAVRGQLRKNAFFLLEEVTTGKLLLAAGKQAAAQAQTDLAGKSDRDIIGDYLKGVAAKEKVTEAEAAEFYEKNKEMCGGAKLEQIRPQIQQYLLQEKQREAVTRHIRDLGKTFPISVSASWAKPQAALALDNPVDKARRSGKPSVVDFGADGCRPCDMMAPILKTLREKYEGRANVAFVHVREEQVLAARYGIQSIPVQVFFDKDGKEAFRHTGFFPQDEIEGKLGELGVK